MMVLSDMPYAVGYKSLLSANRSAPTAIIFEPQTLNRSCQFLTH